MFHILKVIALVVILLSPDGTIDRHIESGGSTVEECQIIADAKSFPDGTLYLYDCTEYEITIPDGWKPQVKPILPERSS